MTTKNPDSSGRFSAFSSAGAESQASETAHARHQATDEGRTVLALEMIADQLALIHRDLRSIDDFARGKTSAEAEIAARDEEVERAGRDNQGGNPTQEVFGHSDNVRSVSETLAVGAFNYTDLPSAIAEAKRLRRAHLTTNP